jgi:hypothetical protein
VRRAPLRQSPGAQLRILFTRYEQPGEHLVEKVRFVQGCQEAGDTFVSPASSRPRASTAQPQGQQDAGDTKEESRQDAGGTKGRVYINKTQFFEGVPKDAWEFHIGGYQVCEKWLKDRKGRSVSSDDIDHYQKIVVALAETIRLMKEIDEVIPGWPLP